MKPKHSPLRRIHIAFTCLSAAGLSWLCSPAALAASVTWDGAVSGVWDAAITANWSGSTFTSGNDALFTGTPGRNVTAATGLTIGAITLDSTFTGSVALTGANTIAGPVKIQGGKLIFSAANQLGTSGITLDGGTLNTSISSNSTISITNVITVNSASTIQMSNTSTAGTPTFILNGAGKLTGSGALTVKGNGGAPAYGVGATDMVLNNTNAGYTGNLTLQDGAILEYNNVGSVGTGATFTVGNNGVFSSNFNGTDTHAMTLNAGGTLASQNSSSVIGGAITLGGDASIRLRDWYDSTNKNLAITNTITGARTLNVNSGGDTGTGATLTLRGFNATASSANLVLNGASLAIDSSAGTAAASVTRANSLTINTGNLTVTGVATQNTNDVFGTFNLGGGSSSITPGGILQGYSTWTLSPNASTNTALTFTNMGTRTAGSWVAINSTVGATPAANTSNIFFTNAPSGSNFIGGGGALGTSTSSIIPWLRNSADGNTFYTYDATVGVTPLTGQVANYTSGATTNATGGGTLAADQTVNSLGGLGSNIVMAGHTLTVSSGALAATFNATIGSDSATPGTLNFGTSEGIVSQLQARTLTINSAITGSGGMTFLGFRTNSGNKGSFVLNGANTYTGVTNIYGYGAGGNAVLSLTHSLALQNSTLNYVAGRGSNISFGNGGTSGQTAYTLGGLSGNLDINLNNNNTTAAAVALTVGQNNSSTTYSGVLSSTVAGGSLTKSGTGTLTLTGASTYTGPTNVNNGTLVVNGSLANTTTTIASGAVLAGNGSIAGITAIAGSLRPGNSIGTLNIGNDTTWNSGDAWVFELGGPASSLALAGSGGSIQDMLNITGTKSFLRGTGADGSFAFDFAGTGATGWYKLVDWDGSTTFTNSAFVAANLAPGLSASFTVDPGTSALYLNVIPEPRAALLGSLGLLALLRRRRR